MHKLIDEYLYIRLKAMCHHVVRLMELTAATFKTMKYPAKRMKIKIIPNIHSKTPQDTDEMADSDFFFTKPPLH